MIYFPQYQRRLDLMLKNQLSSEERQELSDLDKDLAEFKQKHPDFTPGGTFRASLGDMLKAKLK